MENNYRQWFINDLKYFINNGFADKIPIGLGKYIEPSYLLLSEK